MTRLWLADVHANLPALEAVLADAGTVDEIIFLGDMVGCGPHPAECVAILMELAPRAVLGNHDAAVLGREDSDPEPNSGVDWDLWTLHRLDESQRAYLRALPETLTVTRCGLEATIRHQLPATTYLHPAMPDDVLLPYLQNLPQPLTVCGHSHRAMDRTVGGRRLLCLPGVGQPRNGDPRAGYALERQGEVSFHFVAYDVERVVADVLEIGLDEAFCRRWVNFVRTASDPDWSREYTPDATQ
jgi:predicted phosphodiesterase